MIAGVKAIALVALIGAAMAAPAGAQGKSASAPGQSKKGGNAGAAAAAAATVSPATATSATSAPSSSPNNVLYYGSWLDDASVMERGSIWMGASTAYWKADTAHQVDVPVLMGAAGLTRRVQVGASLPIYHFQDQSGLSASGVGTVSVYGKLMLMDAGAGRRLGLAVAPLIELAPGADGAFGWALPVNVETRADRFRVYGSAGYFSRGSIFGTAAVEVPTSSRTAVTGTFGQSHAGGATQTSLGVSLSFAPEPSTGLFMSLGHSSGVASLSNGGVSLGGGVSVLLK